MLSFKTNLDEQGSLKAFETLARCPYCTARLKMTGDESRMSCRGCSHIFEIKNGIPLLYAPNEWGGADDVTERVRSFYMEHPFPGYDRLDTRLRLKAKAENSVFMKILNDQIKSGSLVLEAGCGTGQESNFLALDGLKKVIGTDMCLNSLKLAQNFKVANDIGNVSFVQMNLFRPVFKRESFDYVICNGVLHHTSRPVEGFRSLLSLVKSGGYIIIGLYNSVGRISNGIKKFFFKHNGVRFKFLDKRLVNEAIDPSKRHAWFMDQYRHPHESRHTFGEILRWFRDAGVEFISSVPKMRLSARFLDHEDVFEPQRPGNFFERAVAQWDMIWSNDNEGGFFILIGRKVA